MNQGKIFLLIQKEAGNGPYLKKTQDGFDLNTVHKPSSNEKIPRPRFEPGAAGREARMLSIVLCGPPKNCCLT